MNFRYKFFITLLLYIFIFPSNSFADDFIEETSSPLSTTISVSNSKDTPSLNARYAVIYDRASKTVLYGKNENEKCKMASTTKILTAIVVLENVPDLSAKATISSKSAHTGGSRLGLSTGDIITIHDLLYGLLMVSGNDAAVALAEFTSGSIEDFSKLMNEKASSLGLTSSHFVTPHGLDQDEHYTTAYELAKIADYALGNETFSKIVNTSSYTVLIDGNSKNLHNTNELLGSLDGVYGIKTGFTNGANRCLVTSCKRGNLDIISVVLGCDTKKDRTMDSIKLINYAFNNFTLVNVDEIIRKDFNDWVNQNSRNINIEKGIYQDLNFSLDESQIQFKNIAVNNDFVDSVNTNIEFSNSFDAPLLENSVVGNLTINVNGLYYFSVDVLNKTLIKKKNIFNYLNAFAKNYFTYFDL